MIEFILLDPVPRCFYPPGQPEPVFSGMTYPLLINPGEISSEANWQGRSFTPSLAVALDNSALTAIFADPPLRGRLQETDGAGNILRVIFEGEIDSVTLSDSQVQIGLVA